MNLVMARQGLREFGIVVLILSVAFAFFYFRLFFKIEGFIEFPNFSQSLNLAEAKAFFPFYDPFSNFGSVSSFSLGEMEYSAIGWMLIVLPSIIFGLAVGTKIYIFLASLIFGLSFFSFTSIFTKKFTARLFGTLFFLFNPFTIQLYTNGDFSQFIFQSFIFLGLLFFNLATTKNKFLHPYFLISALSAVLAFIFIQVVISVLIFYIIIAIYILLFSLKEVKLKTRFLILLKSISSLIISGLFLGSIVILPLFFGPVSYLPGSLSSLPLSTFVGGALNVFKVITLKAYPPALAWVSVRSTFGSFFYSIWSVLEIIMIVVILLAYILIRSKKFIFFSSIAVVLSLFASETAGPIGPLTTYLYEHLPAYQGLNYPYLWVWSLIMPIYSIIIVLIFSEINWNKNISDGNPKASLHSNKKKKFLLLIAHLDLRNDRKFGYVFSALVIFVLLAPIASQGYYGVNGIEQVKMPSWFNNLDAELVSLTGQNDSGVIFNTINPYFQFGNNSSDGLCNLLQGSPQFRTVELSNYIPNYNTETDFYYWFYYILYNNETKYSAQILATVGVQYFVDIYNANTEGYPYFVPWSYNVNASTILLHQQGWERVTQTQNYSIFKNEYYNGNDYYTSNLSLVLGNYNTLNDMAYLGVNLANSTNIFPTDLTNSGNITMILDHTNLLVLSGNNSIYDLILALANSTPMYTVNSVNGELSDGSTAWINSERNSMYPYYGSLLPYAETSGNNTLNIPVSVSSAGNYDIFVKIAFSNSSSVKGGLMDIGANGKTIGNYNTSRSYRNATNSFLWIKLNADLAPGKNVITLHSQSGFNAASEMYVVNRSNYLRALTITDHFLSMEKGRVMEIYEPQQIVPSGKGQYYYGSDLGHKYPGGNYLYMSQGNMSSSFNISTPTPFNGTILINLLSNAYATLNVSYGDTYTNIGVAPGIYIPSSNASEGQILLPVRNLKSANIKIITGIAFVGLVALLPAEYIHSESRVLDASMGNLSYRGIYGGISNFTMKEDAASNYAVINGSFSYRNVSDYFPISLSFTGKYYYNLSPIFVSSVNGTAEMQLNGVTLQSNKFDGQPMVSPDLNDQYEGRPSNITLNFVPDFFNSNTTYNVSFSLTFYGFSYFPKNITVYSSRNSPGPDIFYTSTGYKLTGSGDSMLIIRFPFLSGFEYNAVTGTGENSLNTLIFAGQNASVNSHFTIEAVTSSFKLFTDGLIAAVVYSSIFLLAYYLLPSLRNVLKKRKKN